MRDQHSLPLGFFGLAILLAIGAGIYQLLTHDAEHSSTGLLIAQIVALFAVVVVAAQATNQDYQGGGNGAFSAGRNWGVGAVLLASVAVSFGVPLAAASAFSAMIALSFAWLAVVPEDDEDPA